MWLDRLVGAQAPNAIGLFYQWGDIIGHGIAEGYEFDLARYQAKGLNLISADLDDAHDAARAFYGSVAKMPSSVQIQELIDNCLVAYREDGTYIFTSNINGNSIIIRANGFFYHQELYHLNELNAWSSTFYSEEDGSALISTTTESSVSSKARHFGLNVMAIHS